MMENTPTPVSLKHGTTFVSPSISRDNHQAFSLESQMVYIRLFH